MVDDSFGRCGPRGSRWMAFVNIRMHGLRTFERSELPEWLANKLLRTIISMQSFVVAQPLQYVQVFMALETHTHYLRRPGYNWLPILELQVLYVYSCIAPQPSIIDETSCNMLFVTMDL
jgi:hypothetical protein